MHIQKFILKNYKSIFDSGEILFTPGFNVIVGPNNAGKTALSEGLELNFADMPHKSLETKPTRTIQPDPTSSVEMTLSLTSNEALRLLAGIPSFPIPCNKDESVQDAIKRFEMFIAEPEVIFKLSYQPNKPNFPSAWFESLGQLTQDSRHVLCSIKGNPPGLNFGDNKLGNMFIRSQIEKPLAEELRKRIYRFKAERLNVSECSAGGNEILFSDARNLAEVLNHLQHVNPPRYNRFNKFMNTIFPDIKLVSSALLNPAVVKLNVWTVDPIEERNDLSIPLIDSGTGIGQVAAILYVVMNSDEPRIIIIDEPQSFLHPGAVRKLLEILNLPAYRHHQFIVMTHSPTALSAANPQNVLAVKKDGAKSVVNRIDKNNVREMETVLAEVGARLSDVFGADRILWVEGRTEETCFPLILEMIMAHRLGGTVILGIVNTGDFNGRHSRLVIEIYKRLSGSEGLMPPSVVFLFDREKLSESDLKSVEEETGGKVKFLKRRMYENYLIHPGAIAAHLTGILKKDISEDDVDSWIKENQSERKYFKDLADGVKETEENWLDVVDGAKFLDDMYQEFSAGAYDGNKVKYGEELTIWIAKNAPQDLRGIGEELVAVMELK